MSNSLVKKVVNALIAPVIALVIAAVVSSIALLLAGHSPIAAVRAMTNYVTTTDSFVVILNRAAPLYVVALGVAIGFKMNLFNIGADGQYRLAALIAAAAGAAMDLPRVIQIVLIMMIAMAVGGFWAAIPGVLKVTRGVNEVVTTIMLNYVATGLSAYLLATYFYNREIKKTKNVVETHSIPKSGRLPDLDGLLARLGVHLPRLTHMHSFILVAALVGVAFYLLVWRTRFGYDLRMTGASAAAARSSGVNPKRMVVTTIIISGALSGLAAMGFLLTDFPKYDQGFPLGLAFTGIAVALLGRNHPGGIAAAAFFWAGIERASQGLSTVNIPGEITKILQGTLLIGSVIAFELVRRRNLRNAVRHASFVTSVPTDVEGVPA
jgi:ABC-type uncharacterized transport system permease subunit